MGKPLGNDLRRKLLLAFDQGEGSLQELADRFLVSVGWAKKISAARNRTGQAERVPHHPGRKPRLSPEQKQLLVTWLSVHPDLTLAELQAKLQSEQGITMGLPRIWRALRQLNVRLKKSHSTLPSATPVPTRSDAKNLKRKSQPSRVKA